MISFYFIELENASETATQTLPTANFVPSTIKFAPSAMIEFDSTRYKILPSLQSALEISKIKLKKYSSDLDRTDLSNRAGALLATMLLKDILITAKQFLQLIDGMTIDKNKIHRKRVNFREETIMLGKPNVLLQCISFDGKIELTLKKKIVQKKNSVVKVKVTRRIVTPILK